MKIVKLALALTGIMSATSLASAAINIDAKAYHEQRQAEKKARLEAEKNNPSSAATVTPAKIEQKAKTAAKGKKQDHVAENTLTTPEEKIEHAATPSMANAAVNAASEQTSETVINAQQAVPAEQPQSL